MGLGSWAWLMRMGKMVMRGAKRRAAERSEAVRVGVTWRAWLWWRVGVFRFRLVLFADLLRRRRRGELRGRVAVLWYQSGALAVRLARPLDAGRARAGRP